MQDAKNLADYRRQCQESLENDFLRKALDAFAVAYRTSRANAFAEFDVQALINEVADMKDDVLQRLDELYDQFKAVAEAAGVTVHLARDGEEANRIIIDIARQTGSKNILKTKSMTAEETLLNHALEDQGLTVIESDLGEWIIQLRHEPPSHMVMPAIHLSRYQVSDLFSDVTGTKQEAEIEKLVKVARRELRQKFVEADMAVTGANFAVAETGTIATVTNEGNARLATTLPPVHVALFGIDKLVPTVGDALKVLRVLPRNATGQQITSYITWVTGANECAVGPEKKKNIHFVVLDNGRREMAKDPLFSQVFRCVRCGACANVCPVYRLVGGHKMGHIYIGAIGLILTYFFHGRDKARNLVQNCINCEACKDICAGGIDLPRLIKAVHARIQDEEGHPLPSLLLGKVLRNRKFFHTLLRTAKWAQKPVAGSDGFMRHLPMVFFKAHDFKALPTIAEKPFRDLWPKIKPPVAAPRFKVGLFSGCVQDFVYPEQMVAAVELFGDHAVAMSFPMEQSCCGLPVQMMGEMKASRDVALQNMRAFAREDVDHIVTLCASCASHLKHNYPVLLQDDPSLTEQVKAFTAKVIDLSSFVHDVLQVTAEDFAGDGKKVTFHAPCHLCRGLGVHEAPRNLMRRAGLDYREAFEEEVCCGFGGTYSAKFPELSEQLLRRKLDHVEATGAELLLTDCPGCVMQLRGGLKKRGSSVAVQHTVEALAARRKKKAR
ncbi:L-lactate dehydrogenase (quinone) large subunit LdhH [Desulfofustis limnaeus]|jgi:iron-sulfur cluster protein|uniref:(Fe-S)-binding protein n=1 Tax=Desulfofustis limnaeus TaxID=2740163 RepID=A0ABN6M5J4_9BACT|nr:LUD domain-containing protein [Desulfofustis limnaeus]MDX9893988.1 LUD domain-containing protein [Desulfofustis sp.]BDD87490.1 (Fe-S)-binding protein [Desulfofustis limnaeus]